MEKAERRRSEMKTTWTGTLAEHTWAETIVLTNKQELSQEGQHNGEWIYSLDYQQGRGAVVTFWQKTNNPDRHMDRLWIPEHQIAKVYFNTATTAGEHRDLTELKEDQDAEAKAIAEKEEQK